MVADDMMGHLGVTVNGQGRMLDMNPRPGHFGKNPMLLAVP